MSHASWWISGAKEAKPVHRRLLPASLLSGSACAILALGLHAQEPARPPAPKLEGRALFAERGCAHCHGPEAAGTEDAPDLHGVSQRLKPEGVRSQIVNGGKSMPAFGDALTPEETDTLIVWIRSLKPLPKAKAKNHHL